MKQFLVISWFTIDQCHTQPSSEKLNKYRDPEPDIMLRTRDFGTAALNWMPLSNPSDLRKQELGRQREWRTPGDQGPLNQVSKKSYELTKSEAASTGLTQLTPGSLHI